MKRPLFRRGFRRCVATGSIVLFLLTQGVAAASGVGEHGRLACGWTRLASSTIAFGTADAVPDLSTLRRILRVGADNSTRLRGRSHFGAPEARALPFATSVFAFHAPASSGAARVFQWRPFLAPFHAVVLHYPIGFLTLAFILEIYAWRRPSRELQRVTTLVILLSLVSGVVAATLGLMRAESGGYEARSLALHRNFGLSIPLLTLVTLLFQVGWTRDTSRRLARWAYRAGLTGTLVVLIIGGHLGGNLTHGSQYLVQNAPQFVKTFLEEETPVESELKTGLDTGQKVFAETIQPILESKCLSCHGPEKQKGGYRLDRMDVAFKGGESGQEAIRPKDPMHSELVRRLLLPSDHEDAMPPDGKQSLTAEEILQIVRWVEAGAPFVEKFQSRQLGLNWTLETRGGDGVRLWSQPLTQGGGSSNGAPTIPPNGLRSP